MTKTEILEKIDKGLRGQGNQVDIGNVLADILTEIVNPTPLVLSPSNNFEDVSRQEALASLGITSEQLDDLLDGNYSTIEISGSGIFNIQGDFLPSQGVQTASFGGEGLTSDGTFGAIVKIRREADSYSFTFMEI